MTQRIKLLLLFLLAQTTLTWGSQLPYLVVDHERNRVGMFSVFSYVAGILYHYDTEDYAGMEIAFGPNSPYYDPDYGPNWWEYYCEPICLGSIDDRDPVYTNTKYGKYASQTERHLSRDQVYELIQKYIRIKQHILDKVEEFATEHFNGFHMIAIHYRGTDKIAEAPRVTYDEVLFSIKKYISQSQVDNYKLFVASDELEFIQFLQNEFGDQVITYSTLHSIEGEPLHLTTSNPYLQGEEALIDCLLLAKGDVLIRTSSNLSRWSTFFNPTILSIELSDRYVPRAPKPPRKSKRPPLE